MKIVSYMQVVLHGEERYRCLTCFSHHLQTAVRKEKLSSACYLCLQCSATNILLVYNLTLFINSYILQATQLGYLATRIRKVAEYGRKNSHVLSFKKTILFICNMTCTNYVLHTETLLVPEYNSERLLVPYIYKHINCLQVVHPDMPQS